MFNVVETKRLKEAYSLLAQTLKLANDPDLADEHKLNHCKMVAAKLDIVSLLLNGKTIQEKKR